MYKKVGHFCSWAVRIRPEIILYFYFFRLTWGEKKGNLLAQQEKDSFMDGYLLQRLRTAFPESADPMLIRAINEGLGIADDTISGLRFLQNKAGLDARGFVRRAGVLSTIQEYASRGDLPFEAEFEKQPCGNWHWLNIVSSGVLAHTVKTDGADVFPKDGPAKQDKRLRNQGDLFLEPRLVKFNEVMTPNTDIYSWLSYGCDSAGNITHAIWAIPAADENVYLAFANILESATRQIDVKPSEKTVAPSFGISFTEQVEEALHNSSEENEAASDKTG